MNPILLLLVAMAISMVVIPAMARVAPRLRMVDLPDPRKVHEVPVARVGGWGITLGALLPFALFTPMDALLLTFLWGSFMLMVFGTIDDCFEVGHYTKFIGQFLAVLPVVYIGDLYVERFPFLDPYLLDPAIGRPFTVIAMVGMINAINHSDGLDGLAGGESFLSLIVIALLAFMHLEASGSLAAEIQSVDGFYALVIVGTAMAVIGGLLGFLRFNTHPARVFMGDNGSQFLGFTLAFLTVLLTQRVDTGLSPALPALILGLPIADILAVFYLRATGGMNWFRATRNHVHHRLLDLGFKHFECVVIIYSVQALLVTAAIFLRYAPDIAIISLYLVVVAIVFGSLSLAERSQWRATSLKSLVRYGGLIERTYNSGKTTAIALSAVSVMVPLYFIGSCVHIQAVPRDFGVMSGVLLIVLLLETLRGEKSHWLGRVIIYSSAMFVVYLTLDPSDPAANMLGIGDGTLVNIVDVSFFMILGVAVALAMRAGTSGAFTTTPMDYLIMFVLLGIGLVSVAFGDFSINSSLIIKAVIVLYACELILSKVEQGWLLLSLSAVSALGMMGFRGLEIGQVLFP